jgi:hypothetical protein
MLSDFHNGDPFFDITQAAAARLDALNKRKPHATGSGDPRTNEAAGTRQAERFFTRRCLSSLGGWQGVRDGVDPGRRHRTTSGISEGIDRSNLIFPSSSMMHTETERNDTSSAA